MKILGFDWDSGNWPKCGKHGVSREEIECLFKENKAKLAPDVKHSSLEESRYLAIGRVEQKPMFVAFTYRNGLIRPISARYMHEKEISKYEKST